MISSTSRYADSLLVTVTGPGGDDVVVITPSPAISYTFSYTYYILNGSDRVDNLSNAYYGDPTMWWKIGDANPQIMNWLDVEPAQIIRVPNA
jgi:nucleoid-associated protein YgaU